MEPGTRCQRRLKPATCPPAAKRVRAVACGGKAMLIDGTFPRPGDGRPPRSHHVRRALAVLALTLAGMTVLSLATGGTVGNPDHLLMFTPRKPIVPAADYHRCARGRRWIACSTPDSHRVSRCIALRAPLTPYNCGSSDALPAPPHTP